MQFYAAFKYLDGFNLLLGMKKGQIIFSHSYTDRREMDVILNKERKSHGSLKESRETLMPVHHLLEDYFNGGDFNPAKFPILFADQSKFKKDIYSSLRKVKKGETISYSSLAQKAGYPKASQATGSAMAQNRHLLFVPCHRVIKSNGELGHFSAVINKGFLLDLEKPV